MECINQILSPTQHGRNRWQTIISYSFLFFISSNSEMFTIFFNFSALCIVLYLAYSYGLHSCCVYFGYIKKKISNTLLQILSVKSKFLWYLKILSLREEMQPKIFFYSFWSICLLSHKYCILQLWWKKKNLISQNVLLFWHSIFELSNHLHRWLW